MLEASFVAQDPFLWHATIRENLDPGSSRSDKELWEALDRVGMHENVSSQSDKLDTILEDGGSLSKGQVCKAFKQTQKQTDTRMDIRNNCFA